MKVRKIAIIWIAALLVSLFGCAEKKGEETTAEVAATDARVTEPEVTEAVTTQAVIETEPPTTAAPETTEAVTTEAAKSKANHLGNAVFNQDGYSKSYAVYIGFKETEDGEWIPQEATVHFKIENDNGEVVFEEDRKIKESSFGELLNIDGELASFAGHIVPFSKILKGSVTTGTLSVSATLPDGRILYNSLPIDGLPSDVVATAEPTTEAAQNTYEHNEYYDVVETAVIHKYAWQTTIIHKVLAKKNVSVSSTVIAYAPNGDVVGKSTDSITLTEGEYNYFSYSFDSDISNADLQITSKASSDSFLTKDRSAVEMVKYNKSGNDLYITVKQTKEEIGSFAKYKILYYKNDQIVEADDGYFSISANELDGVGTTAVMSVWAYGIDFDRIEFIYEP